MIFQRLVMIYEVYNFLSTIKVSFFNFSKSVKREKNFALKEFTSGLVPKVYVNIPTKRFIVKYETLYILQISNS